MTFTRVALTAYNPGLLHLPHAGSRKFALDVDPHDPLFALDARPTGKTALKVVHAPDVVTPFAISRRTDPQPAVFEALKRDPRVPSAELAEVQTAEASDMASATKVLRKARVAGANLIRAEGLTIVLAGIAPPSAEAKCKRIDGVVQACMLRAEHRLAILLQARRIVCRLVGESEEGALLGHCKADDIDISADLVRQGLARKLAVGKVARAL